MSTHILAHVAAIFDEFDLKPIIESQQAQCDDIAFTLAVSYLHGARRRDEAQGLSDAFIFRGKAPCTNGEGVYSSGSRRLLRGECLNLLLHQFTTDPLFDYYNNDTYDYLNASCSFTQSK